MIITIMELTGAVSRDEVQWLVDIGCSIEVTEPVTLDLNGYNGQFQHIIVEPSKLIITTTNETINSLLTLKYSNRLFIREQKVTY